MKLLSFFRDNKPGWGRREGDAVVDLSAHALTLQDTLSTPEVWSADGPRVAAKELTWRPPIVTPRKILCVGVNYDLHRQEMGRDVPQYPVVFVRFATSIVGHQQAIVRPAESEKHDYEGELAVVIKHDCRRLTRDNAMEAVAGFTCFNDGSIRDYQRHTSQFTPGKNFDASGACGPWMIPRDELKLPAQLSTTVNGEVRQSASTEQMTFSIVDILEYVSRFTTLQAGDLIATGTPSGVGHKRKPPCYLKDGDSVVVSVEGLGQLKNTVVNESLASDI